MSEKEKRVKPGISVIFPMFNEREYLEKTVSIAKETLADITDDSEIIIVDDASTDGCGEMADELARSDAGIRVIHLRVNSKLGIVLRTGFENATRDLVFYSDMDLPFDWEEVKKAMRIMEVTDSAIVTAYRHDRTSEGWLRSVYSGVYNVLIKVIFGVRVRDINFSFKLFRREILDTIELESKGSFIDAELIIKALKAGYRMNQFGIDYFARSYGSSTLSSPGIIVQILKELASVRLKLFRRARTRTGKAPPVR